MLLALKSVPTLQVATTLFRGRLKAIGASARVRRWDRVVGRGAHPRVELSVAGFVDPEAGSCLYAEKETRCLNRDWQAS